MLNLKHLKITAMVIRGELNDQIYAKLYPEKYIYLQEQGAV